MKPTAILANLLARAIAAQFRGSRAGKLAAWILQSHRLRYAALYIAAWLETRRIRRIDPLRAVFQGRRDNPWPCRCDRCKAVFRLKDARHEYQDDGSGEDVEAVDLCPKCGSAELLP